MGAGAGAEDLQDQPVAVDHLGLPCLLEVALLHGRQPIVDHDEPDALLLHRLRDPFDGALAEQGRRRLPAQRHGLGRAHVEIDRARQSDRFLELGRAVALFGARVRGHRSRPRPWPAAAVSNALRLRLPLSVQLAIFGQISPLPRPCPRRTAAPA